jgi:hypothetical protein
MFSKTFTASIICGLIVLIAQPKSFAAAKPSLAGSWELTFTPSGPPTPPVVVIPGFATFTTNGSVIETDGSELAPGPASSNSAATYGSPGHGIWQLSPCLCSFYISYISLTVNASGSLNSKAVTVATVTAATSTTGTTFTGQYTTTTTGPAGAPPVTTSGTLTGSLIPHPLLP